GPLLHAPDQKKRSHQQGSDHVAQPPGHPELAGATFGNKPRQTRARQPNGSAYGRADYASQGSKQQRCFWLAKRRAPFGKAIDQPRAAKGFESIADSYPK